EASDEKAITLPSPDMAMLPEKALACAPAVLTLARIVVPVWTSWRKTSTAALVSFGTRLVALLWNATNRPSSDTLQGIAPLIDGTSPTPEPAGVPLLARLTSTVVSSTRSRR